MLLSNDIKVTKKVKTMKKLSAYEVREVSKSWDNDAEVPLRVAAIIAGKGSKGFLQWAAKQGVKPIPTKNKFLYRLGDIRAISQSKQIKQ